MPDTRHRIIGREIDMIRCRIEETSIPIAGTSETIDGTGEETRDTNAFLAAIKSVTHSGERQAKFGLGALMVDGCCRC